MNQDGKQEDQRTSGVSVTTKEEVLVGARLGSTPVAPNHGFHHSSVGKNQ